MSAAIKKLIVNDADFWGAPMTEGRLSAFTEILSKHDPAEVYKAQMFFRNEAGRTRMPMPADLIEKMSGFISAEEAYALIPRNEDDSTVWTRETAIAFGACRELIAVGDFYAARLAFISAYDAAVNDAKSAGRKAVWEPSLGMSVSGREKAIADAVDRNRIKVSSALDWVPSLRLTEPMKEKLQLEGGTHLQLTSSRTENTEEPISDEEMEKNRARIKELLATLNSKSVNFNRQNNADNQEEK